MPRITDTNNRQSAFLRAFLDNPSGPPRNQWPTPARLRLWLKRPGFRRAYNALVRATQKQAEFLVHIGSLHAAHDNNATFTPDHPHEISVARRIRNTEAIKIAIRIAAASRHRLSNAREDRPLLHPLDNCKVTPEQAALILKHPDCPPDVAIAYVKALPPPCGNDQQHNPPLDAANQLPHA